MSPSKRTFTFPITQDLKRLLQEVRRREGIAEAEQIRRGLRMWFESKGYRFDEDGQLEPSTAQRLAGAERDAGGASKRSAKKTATR